MFHHFDATWENSLKKKGQSEIAHIYSNTLASLCSWTGMADMTDINLAKLTLKLLSSLKYANKYVCADDNSEKNSPAKAATFYSSSAENGRRRRGITLKEKRVPLSDPKNVSRHFSLK